MKKTMGIFLCMLLITPTFATSEEEGGADVEMTLFEEEEGGGEDGHNGNPGHLPDEFVDIDLGKGKGVKASFWRTVESVKAWWRGS